jgi:hypothetical protein
MVVTGGETLKATAQYADAERYCNLCGEVNNKPPVESDGRPHSLNLDCLRLENQIAKVNSAVKPL